MPEASDRKHFIHGWRLPLVASGLFAVFEWTHLVLNRTADKATLGGWGALGLLDGFLHTVDIPLKLLTLFFVPVALARALAHCHRDARATRFVAGVWLVSGLVLLGVLSAARDPLARLLNNDTVKFYPTSVTVNAEWRFGSRANELAARWSSGEIIAREVLVIVVAIAGLVALGYFLGDKRKRCAFLAALWLLATLVLGGGLVLDLIDYDFDDFTAATLVGPLVFDVTFPMPRTTFTPIASLAYLVMVGSSFFVSRASAAHALSSAPQSATAPSRASTA